MSKKDKLLSKWPSRMLVDLMEVNIKNEIHSKTRKFTR